MSFAQPPAASRTGSRRNRITCRLCRAPFDLATFRDHLRRTHQLDGAALDEEFHTASREYRRSRRSAT